MSAPRALGMFRFATSATSSVVTRVLPGPPLTRSRASQRRMVWLGVLVALFLCVAAQAPSAVITNVTIDDAGGGASIVAQSGMARAP